MPAPQSARSRPGPGALRWQVRWESELEPGEHAALARLLARTFRTAAARADDRSWIGARPELRVVGHHDGRVVAHAGVVRRFLRTPASDTATLVGDVGLVAVDPDRRGDGLGAALMARVATTLADLHLCFGFLTCGTEVRPFYERCGWRALTDSPVHSITIDQQVEHGRHNGMLLAVLAPPDRWPPGPVHRDGQEI